MRTLLLAAALLARPSYAEDPAASGGLFYPGTHFGIQVDGGLPSGGVVALVGRPWRFLRLDAGLGYDVIGFGAKGGVTVLPFHWWVTPTLGFSAGRFFEADAGRFAGGASPAVRQLLSKVGYDYLSADLGLEFGGQNRFVFFVRAGLAYVVPRFHGAGAALQAANPTLRITAADPALSARIPSARVGFLVYVF
jgi:hypothetical protein